MTLPPGWRLTGEETKAAMDLGTCEFTKTLAIVDAAAQKASVAALRWAIDDLEDHWGGDSPVTDALRAKLKEVQS